MNYDEIKQRVMDITSFDSNEMMRLGYTSKIPRIINECLFRIANGILPNLREYKIKLSTDVLPARIVMPPDFLSFANEQDAYLNGKNFVLTNFIGNDSIIVYGNEVPTTDTTLEYTIFYNAYYPKLIAGGSQYECVIFPDELQINSDGWSKKTVSVLGDALTNTPAFELPQHISDLIPHYVAGQLLALDDKVRSITELNEFEVMLAQIDNTRNERQRDYQSVRGWY